MISKKISRLVAKRFLSKLDVIDEYEEGDYLSGDECLEPEAYSKIFETPLFYIIWRFQNYIYIYNLLSNKNETRSWRPTSFHQHCCYFWDKAPLTFQEGAAVKNSFEK